MAVTITSKASLRGVASGTGAARGEASGTGTARGGAQAIGKDGLTPHIGENGNWWIGDEDTGKPSRGDPGPQGPKGDGVTFKTDETLTLENGVLRVNTATEPETDNTLPITSAAVAQTVGNIEILLELI